MDNQHCSAHAISGADGVLWTLWSTRSRLEQFARGAVYTYTRCFSCIKSDMSIPRLKEMIMKVFCCATDIISFLLMFKMVSASSGAHVLSYGLLWLRQGTMVTLIAGSERSRCCYPRKGFLGCIDNEA
jgi:hypothetical protein